MCQRFASLHELLSLKFILGNIDTLLLHTDMSIPILLLSLHIDILIRIKFVSKVDLDGWISCGRGVVRNWISRVKVVLTLWCSLTRSVLKHLILNPSFIVLHLLLVDFIQTFIASVIWVLAMLFLIHFLLLMAQEWWSNLTLAARVHLHPTWTKDYWSSIEPFGHSSNQLCAIASQNSTSQ